MSTETAFKLHVPQADLDLLHQKLALTRLPDELEGAGWDYGVPLAEVKRLVARWKEGFDWRAAEDKINELPMFTRDIEVEGFGTLNMHYVHQRSTVAGAIPLLFCHGCESFSCGLVIASCGWCVDDGWARWKHANTLSIPCSPC